MIKLVAAVVAALALLAAACGGDEEAASPEEEAYAQALSQVLVEAGEAAGPPFDAFLAEEPARCLGGVLVRIWGVEAFDRAGVEPGDIAADPDVMQRLEQPTPTEEQADEMAGCFLQADLVAFVPPGVRSTVGEAVGPEKLDCMAESMRNNAELRAALAQAILGGEGPGLAPTQAEAANTAAEECLTAEEREELGLGAAPAADDASLGAATASLLDGIPQEGIWLGDPDAPVVMVEFVDMQCPFCRRFAVEVLPSLIGDYVRPGNLRIAFRGISFIGPDSEKAARAVYAAGEQNRLWYVEHILFEQQGGENAGWVTDDLLRAVAEATPGLDVERFLADSDSAAVDARIDEAAGDAQAADVQGTPSFLIGPPDDPRPFRPQSLTPDAFRPILDEQLRGSVAP